MISHYEATMAMRHRQIEMERKLKFYEYRAARDSMPRTTGIARATTLISSLIGKGRVRATTAQPAC